MSITPHDIADLVIALAPTIPVIIHLFGWDATPLGSKLTSLLPDLIGFLKKLAPPVKP